MGLILTTQQAVKHFDSTGGNIVNISSLVSTILLPNNSVYSATKVAVDAITKSFSKELGSRNIRVNAINPGSVETEGTHAVGFNTQIAIAVEVVEVLHNIQNYI